MSRLVIGRIGLGLGLGACGGTTAGPVLLTVTPDSAPAGTQVTLTGEQLCGAAADCATAGGELDLDLAQPVRAEIASYSDTQILFTFGGLTPAGATELVLTLDDTASNALAFTVEEQSP